MTKEQEIKQQEVVVADLKIEAEKLQKQAVEAAELKLKVAGAFEYSVQRYREANATLLELQKPPVKE